MADDPKAPTAPSTRVPAHPDTNKPSEEAPPGSSTTPVPQQIPKQGPK